MSRLRWVVAAVAMILVIGAIGFLIWAFTPLGPMPEALAALQSDSLVTVDTDPWLIFRPAGEAGTTGLILYPGGRVDPRSYAPTARAMAARGYTTVIVPMPLNLAVLDAGAAGDVMAAFPEIERWAIGGHSLGGAMAANFAHDNDEAVDGLALWAAYPAASDDLSSWQGAVTSISATLDGLATPDKIAASEPLLPAGTAWVAIAGGNHAQFGWYGPQGSDNEATISREEQQGQLIAATMALLQTLSQ